MITRAAVVIVTAAIAGAVMSAGCGRERRGAPPRTQSADYADPPRPLPQRLLLRRAPYLGVSCSKPNSIACDRVRLAVSLRAPARRLTATIGGRKFTLRPPDRAGYWEGALRPAGLLTPGSALYVIPDRGRYHWIGRHRVRVVVHLTATAVNGAPAGTSIAVDLHAGYG